jgi:hypothetical protein
MLMQHKLDSHATALQRGLADVNKRMDADKSARVCVPPPLLYHHAWLFLSRRFTALRCRLKRLRGGEDPTQADAANRSR